LSTQSAYIATGKDVETNEEVAIKLEHHTAYPSFLEEEVDITRSLSGRPGFPQVYWDGVKDGFTVMVFELLGPNLEDLFRYCGNRFSLKTTLMIFDQLLYRFESLHSKHYLHRDVKPENFLMGVGRRGNIIYMTDLGLAIYHQPDETVSGSTSVRNPQLIGTCRYASINGHLGIGGHSICHTTQVYS
jgi:serine/threonine protein kinase